MSMGKKEKIVPKMKDEAPFLKGVREAIKAGRHTDYLRRMLEEYEAYKSFFLDAFAERDTDASFSTVFKFRVEYRLKHPIWREFEVVGNQSFEEFSEAIIESMDFANDHLHAFFFPEKRGKKTVYAYSSFVLNSQYLEDDPYPTYKTNQVSVSDIDYAKYSKLVFIFDFGESHEFTVVFQGTRPIRNIDDLALFPRITDLRGIGPEQYPDYDDEEE